MDGYAMCEMESGMKEVVIKAASRCRVMGCVGQKRKERLPRKGRTTSKF
jgi:hypothetical protein